MGLCVYCNSHKNPMSIDGGYGMLATIRIEVAKAWHEEFGNHYKKLFDAFTSEERMAWDKKANEILSKIPGDDDVDIVDFLFQSDCEGSISYKTCKKIYNLIKDDGQNFGLGYYRPIQNSGSLESRESVPMSDWSYFKQMLLNCYSHRCKLGWY